MKIYSDVGVELLQHSLIWINLINFQKLCFKTNERGSAVGRDNIYFTSTKRVLNEIML